MTAANERAGRPATTALKPEMQAYLNSQLEAGERVLWAGTTDVAGRMRRARIVLGITCLFLMFMCSGIFLVIDNPDRWLLVTLSLLGWPAFWAIGIWLQSGHLRRTLYAVTDRRALILSVGKPRRTQSYPPEKLDFLRTKAWKGGRGTLYFAEFTDSEGATAYFGFEHIADVKEVAALMQRTFGPLG
jgi:hypothetical protein